ncbi:bifunctional nicotinamidase/pyrazinamidase [Neolewinella lacunae]|uniref:Nicotinamidase n=1 Tax=Neolewinella lacunae TaxID=1517758 RepID=A0A923TD19_9BACT|nr:bifunctional nicotinamidase/pyrazinamidase [Neolewinella lacunae]MBC6994347.1 bifunctional nicotinamidase/pyrazinamidase [Neolewinella lacunae]MDN3635806.1 bifunctional nicotinamidase/pyrazinamidase [Neolewinella lacunae]
MQGLTTALILVDLQVDFMPTGMLPVAEGDRIVPLANRLMGEYRTVVATQDWHPADHQSFAANHPWRKPGQVIDLHGLPQVLWPIHCVQGTWGAEFVSELRTEGITQVFQKGTDPTIDSYSGFYDNGHRRATGLAGWLRERRIEEVHVLGLATDYCVKFTALDALREGFRTCLVVDACRGVDLVPGDVDRAIAEMAAAGVVLTSSAELLG